MVQTFCHWSFIWMITWMVDNGIFRHTMQSNYIKRPTTGIELNWIELNWKALTWNWCRVICELYWLYCTIWRLEIPQCFLFFYYEKVLMIGFCPQIRKLEWMIHTVPLKSKLTVTRVSILETRFSRVDSRFSKLLRKESRVTMIKDRVSMFVSGNIMTFSWECTC